MNCIECGGFGGQIDIICDDGTGPFEECGFCRGTGEISLFKWLYFRVLFWCWGEKPGRH